MPTFIKQPTLLFHARGSFQYIDLKAIKNLDQQIADIIRSSLQNGVTSPIELAVRRDFKSTDFKTFDQQMGGYSEGNVKTSTMYGQIIRPRIETDMNGNAGGAQAFDLQQMRRFGAAGVWVLDTINGLKRAETETITAYLFFMSVGSNRTSIGAMLVDRNRNLIVQSTGRTVKRQWVIDTMVSVLTNEGLSERTPVVTFDNGTVVVHRGSLSKLLTAQGQAHKFVPAA